jgi:hypothetical protein
MTHVTYFAIISSYYLGFILVGSWCIEMLSMLSM